VALVVLELARESEPVGAKWQVGIHASEPEEQVRPRVAGLVADSDERWVPAPEARQAGLLGTSGGPFPNLFVKQAGQGFAEVADGAGGAVALVLPVGLFVPVLEGVAQGCQPSIPFLEGLEFPTAPEFFGRERSERNQLRGSVLTAMSRAQEGDGEGADGIEVLLSARLVRK